MCIRDRASAQRPPAGPNGRRSRLEGSGLHPPPLADTLTAPMVSTEHVECVGCLSPFFNVERSLTAQRRGLPLTQRQPANRTWDATLFARAVAFRAAAGFNLRVQPTGSATLSDQKFMPGRFGIFLGLLVFASSSLFRFAHLCWAGSGMVFLARHIQTRCRIRLHHRLDLSLIHI